MYLFLALFTSWMIWSGQASAFFFYGGVISCVLVVMIARRMSIIDGDHLPLYFRWRMWRYIPWLLFEIMLSAIEVCLLMLKRTLRISPILGSVDSSQRTEEGIAAFATSITLTPGTVSVGVRRGRLLVHALDKSMYHTLMEETMDTRVTREVEA